MRNGRKRNYPKPWGIQRKSKVKTNRGKPHHRLIPVRFYKLYYCSEHFSVYYGVRVTKRRALKLMRSPPPPTNKSEPVAHRDYRRAAGFGFITKWRRGGDLNPRYRLSQYNCLAGSPVQPLQHLSSTLVRRKSKTESHIRGFKKKNPLLMTKH